jgi:Rrf2 family transcriptional regulator, nitric oxide-sensitive transcriptional repressor
VVWFAPQQLMLISKLLPAALSPMLATRYFHPLIWTRFFMRLTSYTDYALRVLLYTGAAGRLVTISNISDAFGISKEHLRKVVHSLSQLGYLTTTQGRNGGITLAKPAEEINIRDIVLLFETTPLVECFDNATNTCQINGMCGLKHALAKAQRSFLDTLGTYYLSDLIKNPKLVVFARSN